MTTITPTFTARQEQAIVDALARRFTPGDTLYVSILEVLQATHAPAGPTARTSGLDGFLADARTTLARLADHEDGAPGREPYLRDAAELLAEAVDLLAGPRRVAPWWQRDLPGAGNIEAARELAAEAAREARTMAPPVPGITQNAGWTVRAVLPGHDASPGLLRSWWVAAEQDGGWVTWEAYELDGSQAGKLAYNAGHYYDMNSPASNRHQALANLAERAGIAPARHEQDQDSRRAAFRASRDETASALRQHGLSREAALKLLLSAVVMGPTHTHERAGESYTATYDDATGTFTLTRH